MTLKSCFKLLACLALCLGVGAVGGLVTAPEIASWYVTLNKPTGTPPNWVFPVVWNTLYILMGISLWLLWDKTAHSQTRTNLISLFFLQLALNAAWSPVFFMLHHVQLALIIIAALDITVACIIAKAWKDNRAIALIFIPYLVWISYASYLNGGIALLN